MVNAVFLHPDLGIGGAERAVIDAALALKSRGHQVQFVTAHHDPNHCFQETSDGTLQVTAVGDWLPRSIFGRFYAFCAYTRMIYAALYLVIFSGIHFDLIFCDQISACMPVLRMSRAKIIFYCHFPDMLLTGRESLLKRLYRAPLDWLEEKTTGMAHCILVNSIFTAGVFRDTFRSLNHLEPEVLYPIPDFSSFDKPVRKPTEDLMPTKGKVIFLSINRYERKKNLGLAIRALASLKAELEDFTGVHLVMAGGYDERVTENKEYFQELNELTTELDLTDHVKFVRSFNDVQKRTLLKHSTCLLYTPDREHFGIVPIEAMYMHCPVIAVRSGGPLETVEPGNMLREAKTGFLCDPEPEDFALAMQRIVEEKDLAATLGAAGYNRVMNKFSFPAFTSQLNAIVDNLCE